ncbi:MAG: polymer-forming cytoskeletal protein [Acidobacteria bacterium]|nr:polymer-forming cytoskeletal protein [Acidobacteriota bacterium]
MDTRSAIIGPSIHVKGEIIGNEDLVVEGKVEGTIRLKDHHLTIGKSANIQATVEVKSIRVEGHVQGDVMAGERVELATGSVLQGDIAAPRIVIAEGARFKGSVDMGSGQPEPAPARPAMATAGASATSGASSERKPVPTT